jgi:SPP1 gp7 family putative phage head morphogenesis protein
LPFVDINVSKDKEWNSRKINAELLQAIENGESIRKMSERLQRVTDMNKVSAMRNARTMTTSFENLGRLDGMKKMQENGTIVKKKWLATNDSKTRDAHAQLNGVVAEVDEPFRNDLGEIMYPGDPNAIAANIYNCRCTLTYEIEGFEPSLPKGTIKEVK